MNAEHFKSLLARVLDDELTPAQSVELIEWLRQNPDARVELSKHLVLWDLYSQQTRAERSATAFADACRTRIVAETDRLEFVHETQQRLRRSVKERGSSLDSRTWQFTEWIARWLPSPRWIVATALVLLAILALPGFLRTEGVPELAPVAGGRIEILRGQEAIAAVAGLRLQANDVIRTGSDTKTVIAYGREATRIELEPNSVLKLLTSNGGKQLELREGMIDAIVARQRWFHPMLVKTPQAEARVLGTRFTLTATNNRTRLDVSEGKVRFTTTSDGEAVTVTAGHSAIAAFNTKLAALPQTGSILREIWTGIPGGEVNDLLDHADYPNRPAHRNMLNTFETPVIQTNNYACRLIGYIHPPVTGDYTFWIASGSYGTLWLSPDEHPVGKVRIAAAVGGLPRGWAPPKPGYRYQMPQSPEVRLVAGRRYFIQAIEKTATNSSHLEVAWKIPGAEREIISGEFLSPFEPIK